MKGSKHVLEATGISLKRSSSFTLSVEKLAVSAGEVVCLAGANGSGKTTLVDILVQLIQPDSGDVYINGKFAKPDSLTTKSVIGFVPDDDNWLIGELTAGEYFGVLESVYKNAGIGSDMAKRVQQLAEDLLFTSFDQKMSSLSHGNKKKVQIISAIMHQPKLVIVDELRNGLDPIAIKRAENLMKAEAKRGVAVVAATHDLWWAQRFADKIVMIRNGKIVLQDKTKTIVKEAGSIEAKFLELFEERK